MANQYHRLHCLPWLQAQDAPQPIEEVAIALVASGLLRIRTDTARNFVHYVGADFDKHFSQRQLRDPALVPVTRNIIQQTIAAIEGEGAVDNTMSRLKRELNKYESVSQEQELTIARLLAQACEPCVLQLAIRESVSIFVSFSHNVADLTPMHFWQTVEGSGGLQSVSGDGAAVYISCGGDPFISDHDARRHEGDGFPALARLLVIAGQELGHYADIRRDKSGRILGRHSAWMSPKPDATDAAYNGRAADRATVKQWRIICDYYPIKECARQEAATRFYREHKPYDPRRLWAIYRARQLRNKIRRQALANQHHFISDFPLQIWESFETPNRDWASLILSCLDDMAFNLNPVADAYFDSDEIVEEAIACIEALARVPQQLIKWGTTTTRHSMPHLYQLYFGAVITHIQERHQY